MSPLKVERYSSTLGDWGELGEVLPHDPPGSLSDNKPDGTRDLYVFTCEPDDSKSTLYRSKAGVDTRWGRFRAFDSTGLEIVKELQRGESVELTVKTDNSPKLIQYRFTHK